MRRLAAQVQISILLTVVGMIATAIVWVVWYTQSTISPVANAEIADQTEISALVATTNDTNSKVNQIYDYFLSRGLNAK